MKTWRLVGLLSIAPILYAIVLWLTFQSAGLTWTGRGGWSFDAGPVALVGIGGGILVIAATIVLLAGVRPDALRGWHVWGSAVVLAMLAFVATLLAMKGIDHWDWSDERQMRRFLIASWIALGIALPSLGLAVFLRRSPNAVVALWLVSGTLIALVGLGTWGYWSYPIP